MSDTSANNSSSIQELDAQQVEAWLKAHPDFFEGRDELLEQLKVPHPDVKRGAISLLEKQLLITRERITKLDDRLQGLLGAARDTEVQYRQLRGLILSLLVSDSPDDLLQVLSDQLNEQLNIPAMALWRTVDPGESLSSPLYAIDEHHQSLFKQLLKGRHCCCALLSADHYHRLIPDTAELPKEEASSTLSASGQTSSPNTVEPKGSAAITRLAIGHHTGVLVLASPSPSRFNASLDTLFIDYLGEVVGRLLHALSPQR